MQWPRFKRSQRPAGADGLQRPNSVRQHSAAELDQWFKQHFEPHLEAEGFAPVQRRTWIRSAKEPVREGFRVAPMKGGQFVPTWFVSLDFVPHLTSTGAVRWHRTAKSASPDLLVDPVDDPARYTVPRLMMDGIGTTHAVLESIKRSAGLSVPLALNWFGQVSDVRSLLLLFEDAQRRPVHRFGFDNRPQQRLALAFTHAYLGEEDQALRELQSWADRFGVADAAVNEVRQRLDALGAKG